MLDLDHQDAWRAGRGPLLILLVPLLLLDAVVTGKVEPVE